MHLRASPLNTLSSTSKQETHLWTTAVKQALGTATLLFHLTPDAQTSIMADASWS